jgi:hypothetical protein
MDVKVILPFSIKSRKEGGKAAQHVAQRIFKGIPDTPFPLKITLYVGGLEIPANTAAIEWDEKESFVLRLPALPEVEMPAGSEMLYRIATREQKIIATVTAQGSGWEVKEA